VRGRLKTWMAGPSPAKGGFLMPIARKLPDQPASVAEPEKRG